jgi:AP endonuclease-2
MNCRATNYGTRIDYVFVDQALAEKIRDCEIHPDVPDSDHCPVTAEIGVFLVAAEKCPLHCSKNFPEFSGKQQKVSEFFMSAAAVKRTSPNPDPLPAAKKYKQQQQAKQQTMLSFFQAKSAKSKPASTLCQEKAVIAPSDIDKDFGEEIERRSATASAWKTLFKGPPATPNCRGHNEPSVLRTVKKKGANAGRQFWCCGRGEGRADDPNARCDFFKWTK